VKARRKSKKENPFIKKNAQINAKPSGSDAGKRGFAFDSLLD